MAQTRRNFKKKFKVWLWNSWQTFQYIPNLIFISGTAIVFTGLIFVSVLALVAVFGSLYILNMVIDELFGTDYSKTIPLIITLLISLPLLLANFLVLSGIIIASVVANLAVQFTFGLSGLIIGLVTSPILTFVNPHHYWLKRTDAILEHRAGFRIMTAFPTDKDCIIKGSKAIFNIYQVPGLLFPPDDYAKKYHANHFLNFMDFDPNKTKCCFTRQSLCNEEKSEEKKDTTVVRLEEGQYALKTEADKRGAVYDQRDIVPRELQIKFERNVTECSIASARLPLVSEDGDVLPVVRTIHGHYYDREQLERWLAQRTTCPQTRYTLTPSLIFDVTLPVAEMEHASSAEPSPTKADAAPLDRSPLPSPR